MRYLSLDLEATGLREHDLIIEIGIIPFDSTTPEDKAIENSLAFHRYIKCPSFEELKNSLEPWVIEHNESLIQKANAEGISMEQLKKEFESYLQSKEIKKYFGEDQITLFGKSMNAIDLPFLKRDLGWEWINKYFNHKQLDLSSVAYHLIDMGKLPQDCASGDNLMKKLGMGEVCHTALEDAKNTALMYIKLLNQCKK